MATFKARKDNFACEGHPRHVGVRIFAGVDSEHYQSAGVIVLEDSEVEEFLTLINNVAVDEVPEEGPVEFTQEDKVQFRKEWDGRFSKQISP